MIFHISQARFPSFFDNSKVQFRSNYELRFLYRMDISLPNAIRGFFVKIAVAPFTNMV